MLKTTAPLFLALAILMLNGSWVLAQKAPLDGITVFKSLDQIEVKDQGHGPRHTIPVKIEGSIGLKLAFLDRATGGISTIPLNMFDTVSRDTSSG